MYHFVAGTAVTVLLMMALCSPTVTVKHQVEPIHVTVDVYLKAEQQLEDFFRFEEEFEEKPTREQETPAEEGGASQK
ncbi:MAG: hypothetical protein GF401_12470 [Chitinivibrionales bacterium]|nr:hypothetical protein [Chitinivibrionales bacterium]